MLSIGAFSRATLLSVKALRNYHEAGLLVPASVDPVTGYRAYSLGQLTDGAVLRRLRDLDLPLDEVATVLHARDPETTRRVLASHAERMRARLAETERIVAELHEGLAAPALHTPVHLRDEPHRHVLAVAGVVAERDFAAFLDEAYAQLGAIAERVGAEVSGPAGASYPAIVDDEEAEPIEAWLPVAAPPLLLSRPRRGRVQLGELPAVRVAVLAHVGPYTTIGDTYRNLGAWVAEHAGWAELPVREVYVIGPSETPDERTWRSEVQWPITTDPVH